VQVGAYAYPSQHPFMAESVGPPAVCSYRKADPQSVRPPLEPLSIPPPRAPALVGTLEGGVGGCF